MTQGIYGQITDGMREATDCLVIGFGVPRIHSSDRVPVYMVAEHEEGLPVVCKDGRLVNLIAYPSAWPGPGRCGLDYLYAKHERLTWEALIPCFDEE